MNFNLSCYFGILFVIHFSCHIKMINPFRMFLKYNSTLQTDNIRLNWFFIILILHMVMAWFYQGYSHADEHFQILEFAAFKMHHYPFQYPWELYEKLRSTLQIWGIIALHQGLPNASPMTIAFLTRVFAGTLSAYASYLFIQTFQNELRSPLLRSWFLLLSVFSYVALYQSVRYSSENISGQLFLIGFCHLYRQERPTFWVGILLGLSFITRYQTGFLIIGLLAWQILKKKSPLSRLFPIFLGGLTCLLIGFLLDSSFYGTWVSTAWQYLLSNIIQNKAAEFGIDHWAYLSLAYLLPYGPFYLIGTLYFILTDRQHIITWTITPFILIHILIPHKELRFLIPILSFMPFAWFRSLQHLEKITNINLSETRVMRILNDIGWWINGIVVILLAVLLHHQMQTYTFLWEHFKNKAYTINYWTNHQPVYTDNMITSGMPYRYYLNSKTYIKSFHDPRSYQCLPHQTCIVWMPCFAQPLKQALLFDNCSKFYNFGNIHHWKDRAAIYRETGRLYEIKD